MSKENLIKEILMCCKASNTYTGGDLFFSLAFKSEKELKQICQTLYIKT